MSVATRLIAVSPSMGKGTLWVGLGRGRFWGGCDGGEREVLGGVGKLGEGGFGVGGMVGRGR